MDLTPMPGGPKGSFALAEQFDAIVKPAAPAAGIPAPPSLGVDATLLAAARAALGGKLSEPARALLLLRLCERGSSLPPAEAEAFWEELTRIAKKSLARIPDEGLKEYRELQAALFPAHAPEDEDEEAGPPKGFEAEIETEIRAALALAATDRRAAGSKLQACDERVEGRSWPLGKHRVERQLVWAWASVDRDVALGRIDRLKKANRWELLKLLSISEPLTPQAWSEVVRSIGVKEARASLLQLLEHVAEDPLGGALLEARGLYLPLELLEAVAGSIHEAVGQASMTAGNVKLVQTTLATFVSLVRLARDGGPVIPALYGKLLTAFGARAKGTSQLPVLQLAALEALVRIGVDSKLLSDDNADVSFRELTDQRRNLAWARYASETASPDTVLRAIQLVATRTANDRPAIALCLQRLVERGLGREALAGADEAGLDDLMRAAVRRSWLADQPDAARQALTPEQMRGDPVGEFLTQPDLRAMAAYLRTATANGSRALPGAMWVVPGEERPSGFKGRRWDSRRAAMPTEKIVAEYVERTPLYATRTTTGRQDVELEEWVDLTRFGRYGCRRLDPVLLGALVTWGDEHADEVASVSEISWDEILPESQILFANDLRNEILARCATVLAADPDVLLDSCLAWFQREWVRRGRKQGRVEANLPAGVLGGMCVIGAEAVRPFSVARSDHLVIRGLEGHVSEFGQVRSAAAIYAQGKAPLAFEPPIKLKPVQRGAWELGVIDAALPKQIPPPVPSGG